MLSLWIFLGLPLLRALAVPTPHDSHNHDHNIRRNLPNPWYQPRHHPVHSLFRRDTTDGTKYPEVGSPAWSAGYSLGPPDTSTLPKEWVAALNASVAAGKIPDIPQSANTPQTNPIYPDGLDPTSHAICSATYKCRIPGDIWDSPDGIFASSFDDGPSTFTPSLVEFLGGNNDTTTHFMIGVNIIYYPSQFLSAFNAGHDIAVHTWTHPYMTTLSNLDIVGQLGYTMQLIHDSTGGRVPRYWRPPYGDSDMRVRSIALEVFGLETVVWNEDTADWNGTPSSIQSAMTKFLAMPKSPGLIVLEHEIKSITVDAFMTAYPMIKAKGWTFMSLAKAIGDGHSYQNAEGSQSDDVKSAGILADTSSSSDLQSSTAFDSASSSAASPTSATSGQNLAAPTSSPLVSAGELHGPVPMFFAPVSLTLLALSVAFNFPL